MNGKVLYTPFINFFVFFFLDDELLHATHRERKNWEIKWKVCPLHYKEDEEEKHECGIGIN